MGEPVRIFDLAKQMVRLSGKEPDRDIVVEIVGTRPGEKLHEELWGEGETAVSTSHPKIMRVAGRSSTPSGSRTSSRSWSGWCARARRSASSPGSPP